MIMCGPRLNLSARQVWSSELLRSVYEVSAKCLRSVCEVSANITMVTIVTSMVITYHYGNHGKEVSASVRRAYQ